MTSKAERDCDQAEEIASRRPGEVMDEINLCLKMQWYRKLERIIAALIRRRRPRAAARKTDGND